MKPPAAVVYLSIVMAVFFLVMEYKTSLLLDEALGMLETQQKAVEVLCMYVDPRQAPVEVNEACLLILETQIAREWVEG